MKTGVPPTALNARTGLSTPPARFCRAWRLAFSMFLFLLKNFPLGKVFRPVSDDKISTRSFHREMRLGHDFFFIQPSFRGSGLDHCVLAADAETSGRTVKAFFDLMKDVSVAQ